MKYLAVAAVLLMLLVFTVYTVQHNANLKKVEAIAIGSSNEFVITTLGQPDRKVGCRWEFAVNDDVACDKAFIYSTATVFLPEYAVVWFDRDDKVIKTYRYVSP